MCSRFNNIKFCAPKFLAAMTVLSFGAMSALSYHQDQMVAGNVLAQKSELPEGANIQNFDPARHSNSMNKVHLLAELRLENRAMINIGSDRSPNWLHLAALYPVSVDSLPLAEAHLNAKSGTPRRPMPRAHSKDLAAEYAAMRMIENTPIGVVAHEAEDGEHHKKVSADLVTEGRLISEGSAGPLIEIIGAKLAPGYLLPKIEGAFAPYGIFIDSAMMIVTPYGTAHDHGAHNNALLVTDYSWLRRILAFTGALFALLTACSYLRDRITLTRDLPPMPQSVAAVGNLPSVDFFQPIAGQDELEADENSTKRRPRSRILSRVA